MTSAIMEADTDRLIKEVTTGITTGIADLFKDEKPAGIYDRPYINIQKADTIQAARDFHDSTLVKENPSKCVTTITQILYLQNNTGEALSHIEATEIFFGVTKLFVSRNAQLRRMVYVILKDLYKLCDPSDVIIVTSCLTKDMTSDMVIYRANALRVLARIIDTAMLSAIERYVKQAIIDKAYQVSSSALVSSLHLCEASADNASVVKRWVGEVQEALKSPNEMVQFQATQLFYRIKRNDRLAVSKFVQKYTKGVADSLSSPGGYKKNFDMNNNNGSSRSSSSGGASYASRNVPKLTSPLAIVCLIRYTAKLLHEEVIEGRAAPDASIMDATDLCTVAYDFLTACLRHESEMVAFEAAKSIAMLPTQSPEVVLPIMSVLQLSLSSMRPTSRLATVKLLSGLAILHPNLVARFNEGLEALIGDSNRLIGTLAIMTLLKTGNESSMDRLLKNISKFISYIAEEYKIMVVSSLERLCLTYPSKFRVVIGFIAKFLRDEGGFEFKRTIIHTMESLMEKIPETREIALLYLCEFIEDCEFVALSTHVLHVIGNVGIQTICAARYVRFVYNRCILDTAMIRAAAISTLLKFGAHCPALRMSIIVLLKQCAMDANDEVRDRVMMAIHILEEAERKNPYIPPSESDDEDNDNHNDGNNQESSSEDNPAALYLTKMPFSFDNLMQRLQAYKAIPGAMESDEPLDFSTLPFVEEKPRDTMTHAAIMGDEIIQAQSHDIGGCLSSDTHQFSSEFQSSHSHDPAAVIYAIPELASLGRVFRSSKSTALTETETEYVVHCIKHIFDNHVVLQFIVQNTIEDQRLENVSVTMETESELFDSIGEIPCEAIAYGATASCFTILERDKEQPLAPAAFACELKFSVVQVDPVTGEEEGEAYEEDYPLENLEIFLSDFLAKTSTIDFRKSWESIGNAHEMLQKFALNEKSISNAASAVIECVGMATCDGTDNINPASKQHMMHLSGTFLGDVKVLARCQLSRPGNGGVILKMAIRGESQAVSQLVVDCIG